MKNKPIKRIQAVHPISHQAENEQPSRSSGDLAEAVLNQLLIPGETGLQASYKLIEHSNFFGIDNLGYPLDSSNLNLLWELDAVRVTRRSKTRSDRNKAERSIENNDATKRRGFNYRLPKGFRDWDEWVRVVVSKLNAMANLAVGTSKTLPELVQHSLKRLGMIGTFDDGIDKGVWMQIFSALQNDGSVSFSKALRFFQQIDDQRDNYSLEKTCPLPIRQFLMIQHWIHFDFERQPSLCRFDNESGALFLNYLEKKTDENCDGINEKNFSREKSKLGLQSCKPSSLRAEHTRRGIKIIDR